MWINGLIRYNEIQKALSSFRRESGTKFVATFQQTASQIYHNTKGVPIESLVDDIDLHYKNAIPELPDEAFQPRNFFEYDDVATSFPKNLSIRSTQLHGEDWTTPDPEYQIVFKDFTAYCNENKDIFWTDSGDAPRFQFSPIDFDDLEGIYYTELSTDRDDAYGYQPGMGAIENKEVPPSEIREEEEPEIEEIKPEKPKKEKKAKDDLEIQKIQAETEKIKASSAKLTELNKAVENLDRNLERGLITKAEYKKYLKKIYDL